MKYVVRIDFQNGLVVPDARVHEVVEQYVKDAGEIVVGGELLVTEIRCFVRAGYIDPADIVFIDQNGTTHTIGRNAKFSSNFYSVVPSVWEDQLYQLL